MPQSFDQLARDIVNAAHDATCGDVINVRYLQKSIAEALSKAEADCAVLRKALERFADQDEWRDVILPGDDDYDYDAMAWSPRDTDDPNFHAPWKVAQETLTTTTAGAEFLAEIAKLRAENKKLALDWLSLSEEVDGLKNFTPPNGESIDLTDAQFVLGLLKRAALAKRLADKLAHAVEMIRECDDAEIAAGMSKRPTDMSDIAELLAEYDSLNASKERGTT